jgi:hypothetical protein
MQPSSRIVYDPAPFFIETFPETALRGMGQALIGAYRQADDYCQDLPWAQRHDLRAHLRRALAEINIQNLMPHYNGVTVSSPPNNIKSAYHVLVRYQYIYLTMSFVDSPSKKPRQAVFRDQYALSSQLDLFIPSDPPPSDGALYGVIIHGPAKNYEAHPAFMYIVFPNKDWTDYVGGYIDLLYRFPELRSTSSDVVDIKKPAPPKLRKNQEEAEGNA